MLFERQKFELAVAREGAVYSFTNFGCVGKLVTPVDCKSAAPGTAGSTPAASTKNTKTALSKMSRRKPTRERLPGLCESNDARVSRSSRGKKSVVSGKSC